MRRMATVAVAGLSLAWLSVGLTQDLEFKTRLSTVPISPQTAAAVTGTGAASAQLSGRQLTVNGTFQGLQGAASVARLHMGAITGVRGAAVHELEVERAASGRLSGSVQLSRSEVQALRDGRLYIQIDSESAPEGNLWGWLLQ